MDFSDALRMMRQGFRVRRTTWDNSNKYRKLDNGAKIVDVDGGLCTMLQADVLADDWEIVVYDTGLPQGVAKDLRMFPIDDWGDYQPGDYQPGDCVLDADGKWVVLRRDESTITVIRRPSMKAAQEYAKLVKEALKTPKVRRSELEDRRAKLEGELNVILAEIDSMGTVELSPIGSTEVVTVCKSCSKTNVILINGICMECDKPSHGVAIEDTFLVVPIDDPSPAIDFLCDCGHFKSKHCISGCMVTPDEDLSLVGKKDDHGDDLMFCLCLKKPDEIVETETLIVNVTVVTCENGSLPHTYGLSCANAVPVSIDNDNLSKEANA